MSERNTEINITEAEEMLPVYELVNGAFAVKDGYSVNDRFIDEDERKRIYNPDPVLMGYDALVTGVCDMKESVLAYRPDIKAYLENKEACDAFIATLKKDTQAVGDE